MSCYLSRHKPHLTRYQLFFIHWYGDKGIGK